ncbi:hypothetical protein ACF0H5_020860 [Mactra antiquata]
MGRMGTRQLQNYRHDYCKVLMTGLLGCRWHRYQQSTKGSRKRDIIWTIVILLVFWFVTFQFYFWLIADNDKLNFNWYMNNQTGSHFNWFLCMVVIMSIFFAYVGILMFLTLCHMYHGHQLYTHPVHLVTVLIITAACITMTVVVQELWYTEWAVMYVSLQIFGPFLQLGGVVFMTLLSWLLLKKWFKIAKLEWKLGTLFIYCMIMLAIYLSPLLINSPCVIVAQKLPRKPHIIAHRGARMVAPENTVISFERAIHSGVYGIETDVRISTDGIPFIMHDSLLQRTTNVDVMYPDMAQYRADNFSLDQLKNLSAGSWYLETDPGGNVNSLSEKERKLYHDETVPTFLEVLELAQRYNTSVMFDIYLPKKSHPYYNVTFDKIVDIISNSSIDKSKIFWLYSSGDDVNEYYPIENYTALLRYKASIQYLQKHNLHGVHLQIDSDMTYMRNYRKNNMTTSVYMVNRSWLYSFYWCLGVDIVSTDYCQTLTQVETPIWHLSPSTYRVIWILTDCGSVLITILIFLIHRYRLSQSVYHPERASLNSQTINGSSRWGAKRSRRSMKEKLLMRDVHVDPYDFEPDDDVGIDSNGYNVTVNENEGRELAQSFHSQDSARNERNSIKDGNRSSFISSVESGDLYGGHRHSYLSIENNQNGGEVTDMFPNGTTDHTSELQRSLNHSDGYNTTSTATNTYQNETQFT